jgi:PAS domain S-box-containing protein
LNEDPKRSIDIKASDFVSLYEKYKFIFENTNDLIAILNEDFEIEFINEHVFKIVLGYTKGQLVGNFLFTLFHSDDIKNDLIITRKEITNNDTPFEGRLRHLDGYYLWFEIRGKSFTDKYNNIKTVLFLKEISDRKITEQKLKEREERHRRITENINDLIYILNDNYEFEYVNERIIFKFLGYSSIDFVSDSILNYIHSDDIEITLDMLNKRFKIEKDTVELRFKHKEGDWIWFECRGNTYYNKNGDLKWLLILQNITERKLAEERYKNLFESSPNAIAMINFKGNIIDVNSTFEKILGYDKEYLINKNINYLEEIFQKDIRKYFKQIFKSSFKDSFPEPIEIQIKNSHSKNVWVNLQASLFKIGDNISIQFIFQDISEKKKAELLEKEFKEELEKEVQVRTKELNEALEQQKLLLDQIVKSSQFKTEFMSTMSHELRTPLNAIIGFTDLLLENVYGPLNQEQLEFIKDIKSSAEHQFDMIKHILDISKIEAGQITLNIQKFSLNNIIDQIKSSLRPLYKKKRLKFKIKGLEENKEIYADPIRFKEILLNLLSNAVKFTIDGNITLIVQEKYDHWLFKVRDTGIGIARKDFDLIFKEFKRVDSTYVRSVPGTGLGLSLTKRLVNLHGGEISFFSVLGVGTTFSFSILKNLENK